MLGSCKAASQPQHFYTSNTPPGGALRLPGTGRVLRRSADKDPGGQGP